MDQCIFRCCSCKSGPCEARTNDNGLVDPPRTCPWTGVYNPKWEEVRIVSCYERINCV